MLNIKQSCFAFLILVSLSSCSENEPLELETGPSTTMEPIFTFIANPGRNTSDTDDWFLLHNKEGELLFSEKFESGDSLTFAAPDSLKMENLTVSAFVVFQSVDSIGQGYGFYGYGGIEKGRKWTFPNELANKYPFEGKTVPFNLEVNNIPNWYQYNLRNINFTEGFSRELHGAFTGDTDPTNLILKNALGIENNDILLSLIDENRTPKYAWLRNIQEGEDIFLNGTDDLNNFERIIEVPIPENLVDLSYNIFDMDPVSNRKRLLYRFGPNQFIHDLTGLPLGFLEEFNKYSTILNFTFPDYDYTYSEIGPGLDIAGIFPRRPNINITESSYSQFAFATTLDYLRYKKFWVAQYRMEGRLYTINMHLEGPSNYFPKIIEIPSDFSNMYPFLQLDRLELSRTSIYTKGDSWAEYINRVFGDKGEINEVILEESFSVKQN